MAEGEHFEVGMPIVVRLSTGTKMECVVANIRRGKAAYPWPERTILDAVYPKEGEEKWTATWWNAEDPDVHPHPDPDWGVVEFTKHILLYGAPPYGDAK
jgi:hypothetical protein